MLENVKKIINENFLLFFIIYYFTLFIDTTCLVIDYPFLEVISKVTRYIIYLFFLARILVNIPEYKKDICAIKWKKKPMNLKFIYILLFIMVLSLSINLIKTGNKRIIFLMLVLVASYKTDYKKIIKITMHLQIILTSFVVLMCVLGVTQNYIVPRGNIERNSLGFIYTTNLAQMIMFSCIIYIFETGKRIEWKNIFIIQLLNTFTYFITNSRTEFVLLEGVIIVIMLIKAAKKQKIKNGINKISQIYSYCFSHSFVVYPLLSLIIVMLYPLGGIFYKINNLLSNRLKQTYNNIDLYGIKLFGEKIEFLGLGLKEKMKYGNYQSNYIDNEYIQMMFNEGIIFTLCFILILSFLVILLHKLRKYKEVHFCSIYLLFGLINPRIVNILYCPILFMFIPTIIEYSKEIKRKNNEIENKIVIDNIKDLS